LLLRLLHGAHRDTSLPCGICSVWNASESEPRAPSLVRQKRFGAGRRMHAAEYFNAKVLNGCFGCWSLHAYHA
jgi:hypothetical protein